MNTKFYTYILFSTTKERYYTGHTEDLARRVTEHNNGKSSWTRSGVPWELIYYFESSSKSEAMKLENKIKNRGAKRHLIDIGIIY